ncbi:encapsulin-associated ferritin-like protein [Alkaliphilus crotonatoxidans]
MSNYHEPAEKLDEKTKDIMRALNSLKEEVEAIDWYNQRVAVTTDPQLKEILAHNRDEEIEHACVTLEWLRRNMPAWDDQLRNILFKDGPIVGDHGDEQDEKTGSSGLNIGNLK